MHLRGAAADLCLTLSARSRRGSPGCPYGPSPRGSAAERAASAGAAALVLKSPAGADSSCPSLQVSEQEKRGTHNNFQHIRLRCAQCVLILSLLCFTEAGWVKPQWIIGMISFALEGLPVVLPPAPVIQLCSYQQKGILVTHTWEVGDKWMPQSYDVCGPVALNMTQSSN